MNDSDAPRPNTPRSIDLNADVGEGCPNDWLLLDGDLVTSASVACGGHAGDPAVIRQTLGYARDRGIPVGAHPGYPDREHFGRREQSMSSDAVTAMILDQAAFLIELGAELGVAIRFLKPHGALYNQAQRQNEIARGIVDAASELGLPLLGQPGSLLEAWAIGRGLRYIAEGFPDRRYRDDGSLVPRSEPNALFQDPDELLSNVARLVARGRVATLCIHGDEPRAVENARLVREYLELMKINVRSFATAAEDV
jgi:5-oxoprolinase (ATP-hydrolysing) subunit A